MAGNSELGQSRLSDGGPAQIRSWLSRKGCEVLDDGEHTEEGVTECGIQ